MFPESATSGKRRPIPPYPADRPLATGVLSPRHWLPASDAPQSSRKPTGAPALPPGADRSIIARLQDEARCERASDVLYFVCCVPDTESAQWSNNKVIGGMHCCGCIANRV
jgi:hypothetical protein